MAQLLRLNFKCDLAHLFEFWSSKETSLSTIWHGQHILQVTGHPRAESPYDICQHICLDCFHFHIFYICLLNNFIYNYFFSHFEGEKKKLTKVAKKKKFRSIKPWIGVSNTQLYSKTLDLNQSLQYISEHISHLGKLAYTATALKKFTQYMVDIVLENCTMWQIVHHYQ